MSRSNMGGSGSYVPGVTIRLAWMIGMLHAGGFTRMQFDARFPVAERTFRRDIATLREAGFYLDVPSPARRGIDERYRLVCFRFEADAA